MTTKPSYKNYPFVDVSVQAGERVLAGDVVYQKFTCGGCGSRQYIDVPNVFYTTARCEACGATTDVEKAGCNFLLVSGGARRERGV